MDMAKVGGPLSVVQLTTLVFSSFCRLYTHTYILYWFVVSTPLKNMKVSWDYYSQYMENMFQTTNQYIKQK